MADDHDQEQQQNHRAVKRIREPVDIMIVKAQRRRTWRSRPSPNQVTWRAGKAPARPVSIVEIGTVDRRDTDGDKSQDEQQQRPVEVEPSDADQFARAAPSTRTCWLPAGWFCSSIYFSITFFAIGAAASPPWPPCSTSTAMAILRIVDRRIGDKPSMVAIEISQLFGFDVAALHFDNLGCAGFAGDGDDR